MASSPARRFPGSGSRGRAGLVIAVTVRATRRTSSHRASACQPGSRARCRWGHRRRDRRTHSAGEGVPSAAQTMEGRADRRYCAGVSSATTSTVRPPLPSGVYWEMAHMRAHQPQPSMRNRWSGRSAGWDTSMSRRRPRRPSRGARQSITAHCNQYCNHATTKAPTGERSGPSFSPVRLGGGYEIRTREGLPPTRFPSVRPRPLGESSVENNTRPDAVLANSFPPGSIR